MESIVPMSEVLGIFLSIKLLLLSSTPKEEPPFCRRLANEKSTRSKENPETAVAVPETVNAMYSPFSSALALPSAFVDKYEPSPALP